MAVWPFALNLASGHLYFRVCFGVWAYTVFSPHNNRSVYLLYISERLEGYMLFLRRKIQTISRDGVLELGMHYF